MDNELFNTITDWRREGAKWKDIAEAFGFKSAHAARSAYHYERSKPIPELDAAIDKQLIASPDTLSHKPNKWHYLRDDDGSITHVYTMLKDGPVEVPISLHKAMRKTYSDWDGERKTLQQVAKSFELTRSQFLQYKTIHGWTHDMDPYLDDEIMNEDIDQLAENVIQQRRRTLERKVITLQEEKDRRDAEKWRQLSAGVYVPFRDLATHLEIRDVPKVIPPKDKSFGTRKLIINMNDWQIGEVTQGGELLRGGDFNREVAQAALTRYMNKIAEHVAASLYRYDEIILADIGDLGHGLEGYTAHGTPIEVGYWRQEQIHVILNAIHQLIQQARSIADTVKVVHVEGNHLGFNSTLIFDQVAAWYGGEQPVKDVVVNRNYKPVEIVPVGDDSLIVFFHGKTGGPANKAIPKSGAARERAGYYLIMDAVRKYPDRKNIHLVTGHNHSLKMEEFSDFTIHQLGSVPGGASRYAQDLLLSSRPTQSILEVNVDDGLVWPVPISLEL